MIIRENYRDCLLQFCQEFCSQYLPTVAAAGEAGQSYLAEQAAPAIVGTLRFLPYLQSPNQSVNLATNPNPKTLISPSSPKKLFLIFHRIPIRTRLNSRQSVSFNSV